MAVYDYVMLLKCYEVIRREEGYPALGSKQRRPRVRGMDGGGRELDVHFSCEKVRHRVIIKAGQKTF